MSPKYSLVAILAVVSFATIAIASIDGISSLSDVTTRIVNGHNSTPGQFPHQVLLLITLEGNTSSLCGGSLISDTWVLTAAHCVANAIAIDVNLGALNTRDFNETGRVRLQAAEFYAHENYIPQFLYNDIAVIRLNQSVEFSEFIQPVQLPSAGNNWHHDIPVIASGFGVQNTTDSNIPSILQWAPLNTINNFVCARRFGNWVGAVVLRRSVICAVGSARQSGCFGDSGGPLITEDGVLIGIASFVSNHGCHLGYPTGFVRVTQYLDWIEEHTGVEA